MIFTPGDDLHPLVDFTCDHRDTYQCSRALLRFLAKLGSKESLHQIALNQPVQWGHAHGMVVEDVSSNVVLAHIGTADDEY